MKVGVVCSHGGHFTEVIQFLDGFAAYQIFFVTYHSAREEDVKMLAPAYFTENIGISVWRMLKSFWWAYKILQLEKPQVVVSLGAEIAVPFFYLAKLMGIKTIFIESWCRVENLSLTGRLVYPVADQFWVQWPQLLHACGSKARYHGAVL